MIKQTFKDHKGRPKVVLVAVPEDGKVNVSFSMCDYRYDKFNKHLGTQIAYNRAMKGTRKLYPKSVNDNLPQFIDRCKRYYKDKKVQVV